MHLAAYGAAMASGFLGVVGDPLAGAITLVLIFVLAVTLNDFGTHDGKGIKIRRRSAWPS